MQTCCHTTTALPTLGQVLGEHHRKITHDGFRLAARCLMRNGIRAP
jgi:hypothetical protein